VGIDAFLYVREKGRAAYWTSSKMTGGGFISRKPLGSSTAAARTSGGSRGDVSAFFAEKVLQKGCLS